MARNRRIPVAKHGKFAHGVASGFPRPAGHHALDPARRDQALLEAQARGRQGPHFNNVVEEKLGHRRSGAATSPSTQLRQGPEAGHEHYFYRFVTKDKKLAGRALPDRCRRPTRSKPIRIGFYSCQNYEAGYYNAQRGARQRERPRPRPLPRRLHLRAPLLPGPGRPRSTRPARTTTATSRSLDEYRAEVPPLPVRQGPAGHARGPSVRLGLGRPRGRGQLRRRPARLRPTDPDLENNQQLPAPGSVRRAAQERLPGLLQLRCRGSASRATATGSTVDTASASWPSSSSPTSASTATSSRATTCSSTCRLPRRNRPGTMLGARPARTGSRAGSKLGRDRGRSGAPR